MGLGKIAALAIGALLLCSPGFLRAQEADVSLDAVRGLEGVAILVHPLDEKLKMAGLQPARFRELAETELKRLGIPVLYAGDDVPASAPAIELTLTAVREPQGTFYIFDLDFKLRRGSLVRRGPTGGDADAGWRRHWNGMVAVNKLDQIDTRLRSFLQEFASAYREVNRPVRKSAAGE
jgi:hypothetical protein